MRVFTRSARSGRSRHAGTRPSAMRNKCLREKVRMKGGRRGRGRKKKKRKERILVILTTCDKRSGAANRLGVVQKHTTKTYNNDTHTPEYIDCLLFATCPAHHQIYRRRLYKGLVLWKIYMLQVRPVTVGTPHFLLPLCLGPRLKLQLIIFFCRRLKII